MAFAALEEALITEGQFAHFLRVDRMTARQRMEALRETLDEAAFFADIAEFPASVLDVLACPTYTGGMTENV